MNTHAPRTESLLRHPFIAYPIAGAVIAATPVAAYVVLPHPGSPHSFGAWFFYGGSLMVIPSFFLGMLLAILTTIFCRGLSRSTRVKRPLPRALLVGLVFGTLGAYPFSLIWAFSELPLSSVAVFGAGYAYLVLAMGGYSFLRERQAPRRGSTEQLSA